MFNSTVALVKSVVLLSIAAAVTYILVKGYPDTLFFGFVVAVILLGSMLPTPSNHTAPKKSDKPVVEEE